MEMSLVVSTSEDRPRVHVIKYVFLSAPCLSSASKFATWHLILEGQKRQISDWGVKRIAQMEVLSAAWQLK